MQVVVSRVTRCTHRTRTAHGYRHHKYCSPDHPQTEPTKMEEATRRITDLTLQIISLLRRKILLMNPSDEPEEDFLDCTIVEKTSGDCVTPIIHPHVSRRRSRSESPITEAPHSLIPEKILDLTNEITELLTGEVPVRCQDAAVYFSMEEWEYMEGQKDQYQDVRMENDPPRIRQDKSHMTARILPLALQIIALLQGKEPTVVTTRSGDRVTPCMSGGRSKIQSPITEAPPSPTPEKKILQLTNKITELLTGEVPLRCQDVALYFSMEEWDYVGRHRDQYKDVVVEQLRPRVSPENASDRSGGNVSSSLEYNVKDEDILCRSSGENLITPHVHRKQAVKYKRIHTRKKPYSCSECGKCFTEKCNLGRHKRIHTGEKPYSCSECGKCFTGKYNLDRHIRIHTGEKPYSCSECGKCFTGKSSVIRNRRSHTGEKPHSCSKCGNYLTNKYHPVKHKRYQGAERPYSCPECGKCFFLKSHLVIHKRIHTGERPYSCLVCQKRFTIKSSLLTHEKIHTGERAYSCSECGKCFIENSNLIKHKQVHTGERPYSCSECGKCFKIKAALVSHLITHTGEKQFSCSKCPKLFKRKSSLTKHEKIHNGERPYSCPKCYKCFKHKLSLISHEKKHIEVKPYSCSECGKCFNTEALLSEHQRDHTGENPLTCSECGICFIYESSLLRHKKIHAVENFSLNESFQVKNQRSYTVEKPFSCSECGKCFISKDKLRSHQRSRTQGGSCLI